MKTALLVAGEPRFINKCLKHIQYLASSGVHVYFSLWESSAHIMPLLKTPIAPVPMSEQELRNAIGQNCKSILIEKADPSFKSNFHRFIHRLQKGCQLISDEYETIIIVRPDILFHSPWDLQVDTHNSIYHYYAEGECLGDALMMGNSSKIKSFINDLDADNVKAFDLVDWHLYLYRVAMKYFSNAVLLNTWAGMYRHAYFEGDKFQLFDIFKILDYLITTDCAILDHWSKEIKNHYYQIAASYYAGEYDKEINLYKEYFGE